MKNMIFLFVVLSTLVGCAASTQVWYKQSATNQQAQTDWTQCEYEASRGSYTPMGAFDSPISAGIQEGFQKVSLMNKCMTAKGYYLTEKENVASFSRPIYQTLGTFNPEEISWFNQTGTGSIHGNAFVRKQDGAIVSCAGQEIMAIPAGSYANERIGYLYGNLDQGVNVDKDIDKSDPRYQKNMKNVFCDVDGRFKFENLSSGDYYVIAGVFWGDPVQGGANMMKRVSVSNGEKEEITMSK